MNPVYNGWAASYDFGKTGWPSNRGYVQYGCLGGWDNCDGISENGCETDLAHNALHCGDCDTACERPEHGIAGCSNKLCVIGGCNPGWEDCDHNPANGCEREIWTDQECLTCDLPCPGGTSCAQGLCL